MDDHSQDSATAVVEEKPWVFRQERDADGNRVQGQYKVYKRPPAGQEPTELLEGFEQESWNSPLVGNRYITALLKAAETQAVKAAPKVTATLAEAELVQSKAEGKTEPTDSAKTATATGSAGFDVPLIGEEPDIEIVGGTDYYEVTIQEQSDDVKRKDILSTDGVSREFIVSFGKKCILPIGVLNVLRESIYTFMKSHYDQARGEAWVEPFDSARFTIQVHRKVPQSEALEWLKEQKRQYFKTYKG